MPTLAPTAQIPRASLLDHPALPWGLAALGIVSLYGSGDLAAALRDLRLPDTDDAMRFAQVRDLVAGQSWFDMIQHRFLPPDGVASHWSRLVDAPLAGAIAGLTPLLGASLAERLTVAFWPPLLFLVYAVTLYRGMVRLFPQRAAILSLFGASQTLVLTMQFAPGRIDHHNLQIVLLLGVGLCLMQPARTWRTGALAGGLCALSLAVGLEAIPLIALAGLIVLADWLMTGRHALPALAGFFLGLALGAAALFGVQTAPALWSTSACDALSPPWLWLAGTGAALALGAAILRPDRLGARLALTLGIGTAGLVGFAALFPACLHGPFTGMPDLVRLHWLERVREMQPLSAMLAERPPEGLGFSAALFAAAIVATVLAIRDAARRRALGVASLFLAVGAAQTVFHMRGLYVPCAFVPMIAGIALDRALAAAGQASLRTGTRLALLVAALALNSNVWLVSGRLVELGVERAGGANREEAARVQAAQVAAETCSEPATLRPLDALAPGTVLAPIDLGPYLLAHTHHAVVAAPYHRAIAGLGAGIEAFQGDEAALRRQAGLTGAAYLAVCPGKADAATETAFATRLGRGEASASWLDPVAMPGTALKVWRVR